MHYMRKRTTGQVGGAAPRARRHVEGETEKPCTKCGEVKPLDEFWAEPRNRSGRHSACKVCMAASLRNSALVRKYGITAEDYDHMLAAQEGKCPICGEHRALVVDHCHRNGNVRALLCDRCNRLLGVADDNRALLTAAIRFLDTHSPQGGHT